MEDDSDTETDTYHEIYGVQLLDDIHNYLPALLYDTDRFHTIEDVLQYLGARAYHYNDTVYTQNVEEVRRRSQREELLRNRGRAMAYPSQGHLYSSGGIMNTFLSRPPLYHTPVGTHFSIVDTLMQFAGTRQRQPRSSTSTTTTNTTTATYMNPNPTIPLNFFDPVPIVPTQAQIEAGTHISIVGADIELGPGPDDNLCSICQENYTIGNELRVINHCSHIYHRGCIDRWFQSNVHCPLCRHDIRTSVAQSVAQSEGQSEGQAGAGPRTEPSPTIRTPLMRTRDWGELLDSPIDLDSPINPLDETHEMNITANLLQSTIRMLDASGGFGFYSEAGALDEDIYGMDILQSLQSTADISGSEAQVHAQTQTQQPVYRTTMYMVDEYMYEPDDDSYSDEVDSLP